MPRIIFFLCSLFCVAAVGAQTSGPWSLRAAVDYARENNLQVQQAEYGIESADIQLRADKLARLPSLNSSINGGVQFGRTVDPTTNSFDQQTIYFNSIGISTGLTVFNGGLLRNRIAQSEFDLEAARLDAETTANNIGLQVANAYLSVLLVREQITNAQAQLALTSETLTNTERLIRAGNLPEADRFDLVAQQATNERTIVDLENQVAVSLLTLQQLLQLDVSRPFDIDDPQIELTAADLVVDFDFATVYNTARQTQPVVRAAEVRERSAQVGEKVARAGFYPSVGISAGANTSASSAAKSFDDSNVELILGDPVPVQINGMDVQLALPSQQGGVLLSLPYTEQLNQNFGQSISAGINIPIYSRGQNKAATQQALIRTNNARLQREQTEQQLQLDIQRALTDLRAARQSYRAALRSVEAAQVAFDNSTRRYEIGVSNTLDLVTATNRLDVAKVELSRAKYQFIFNRKVVEFYLGQELSIN